MNFFVLVLLVASLLLSVQCAFSIALMLYAWQDEEKLRFNKAPRDFEKPQLSFTILLPARHEETVISDTIQRMVELNYPPELVQILIVIEAGDHGTIAKVLEKLEVLREQGIIHLSLLTFRDPPINKPHGLNIGLQFATGEVVTIFDAEDEPHPDILQVINTVMLREKAPVVQSGVQLMNYADRWFSALNVLEYFFWFRSRLHWHTRVGMVPLGGNTVFIWRKVLEELNGWDQNCLTEDAEIGIRLSAAGVPIRVLYDDEYVTREETPPTVGQFIKQRTRWNQGFLQVLAKKDWLRLPSWSQRLLAFYTLSFPLMQAFMMFYLPLSFVMMVCVKVSAPVALISTLPLYMLLFQLVISVAGLFEFTKLHKFRFKFKPFLMLFIAYLPFQWLLSFAALRAVWRQLKGNNSWEKTTHIGAHRVGQLVSPTVLTRVVVALKEEEMLNG